MNNGRLPAKIVSYGIAFLLCACSLKRESALPEKWHRSFSISLSTGGGMRDEYERATFSHDSCMWVKKEGDSILRNAFPLTEANRKQILKHLHNLKSDEIRMDTLAQAELDAETTSICFSNKKEYCFSTGSHHSINPEDAKIFGGTYRFLMDIARSDN